MDLGWSKLTWGEKKALTRINSVECGQQGKGGEEIYFALAIRQRYAGKKLGEF